IRDALEPVPENRCISSLWEFNRNSFVPPFAFVIFLQPGPQSRRFHTHDRIYMRIECIFAVEYLHRQHIFLQAVAPVLQRFLYRKAQETAVSRRSREKPAR